MIFVMYIWRTICFAKTLLVGKQEGEILTRIFFYIPFSLEA